MVSANVLLVSEMYKEFEVTFDVSEKQQKHHVNNATAVLHTT
jgi:hypothetical protein